MIDCSQGGMTVQRPRGHRRLPWWVTGALMLGAAGVLLWLERRRPLRRRVEPTAARLGRNLVVSAVSVVALQLTERPLTARLTDCVEARRWGLLKRWRLPAAVELPLAVLLLDYTLYLWHVLIHRVPFLWRFHLAHHLDLDLDLTTALRFHFGELLLSAPWRAGQVLLIGVSPLALSVWQAFLLLSVMFHHSNVELPIELERCLCRLIMTPRLHGIHHSTVRGETNSNWSSGFTIWDWLHGTLRLDVPQQQITIGVPNYRQPVPANELLALPFEDPPPAWPPHEAPARTPGSSPHDGLAA